MCICSFLGVNITLILTPGCAHSDSMQAEEGTKCPGVFLTTYSLEWYRLAVRTYRVFTGQVCLAWRVL